MLGMRGNKLTEVLLLEVEGSEAGLLATIAVVQVVVIEAQHGGGVGDEGVGVGVAALGGGGLAAEEGGHAAHESGLAAAGVSGETDEDGALTLRLDGNVALGSANDGLPGDAGTLELAGSKGLRARGGHGHGGHLCV